jgi:hypothetical protein
MRYINVLGPTGFALVLFRTWERQKSESEYTVFYDGGLYLRGNFAAASIGEGRYNVKNANTSEASGLESAKSDCLVRCSKDLGVGLQVYDPAFVRRWQKERAVQVWVKEYRGPSQKWRRKDVAPFSNETPPPQSTPTVPAAKPADSKDAQQVNTDLPWLNPGPDYEAALQLLKDCKVTLSVLKDKWKISAKTMESLKDVLKAEWKKFTDEKANVAELTKLYTDDEDWIKAHDFILTIFTERRKALQTAKA